MTVKKLKGTLKGAMVGAPLIFIDGGKEYKTLSKISSVKNLDKTVEVTTEAGNCYIVNK